LFSLLKTCEVFTNRLRRYNLPYRLLSLRLVRGQTLSEVL
jgi:hypothetical protein